MLRAESCVFTGKECLLQPLCRLLVKEYQFRCASGVCWSAAVLAWAGDGFGCVAFFVARGDARCLSRFPCDSDNCKDEGATAEQEGWNSNLSSTFKACRQLPMLLSYRCTSNQPPGPRFTVTLHRLGMRHSDTFKQNLIAHGLRIGVP